MTQIIDDSELFKSEGGFSSEIDQMAMSQYLTHCHESKQLNADQYQFYMNQLWEHDETFSNNLKELCLWEGYLSFKEQQRRSEQQSDQQKTLMKQNIILNQQKISDSIQKIEQLKQEIEKIKPDFENSQNRYRQYPDNPRLKAEFDKQQGIFDTFQSQIITLQQIISDLTDENDLISSELNQA